MPGKLRCGRLGSDGNIVLIRCSVYLSKGLSPAFWNTITRVNNLALLQIFQHFQPLPQQYLHRGIQYWNIYAVFI